MKRVLPLATAFALLALRAAALAPDRAVTQARLSVWTNESGLPQNTIDAIVQTRDGYLWMGTEEGLVRFDGVRFVMTDRQSAPALRSSFISSLFEGPDGTLWIGTYGGGLARIRKKRVEAFHPELLGADRIRGMRATAEGVVFAATAGGGLLRIDGETLTRFTTADGLPTDRIWTIEHDGDGGLWLATHGGGVVRWRDGRVRQRLTAREGLPNDFARAILRDADGTLWIGTDGGGVVAWRDGTVLRKLTTADGLPSNLIRTLHRDRDSSLWIGTDGGLARWRGTRAEALGVAEGLPSPVIRSLAEDREGSLWVGTTGGIARLSDTRFLSFTRKEGLPVDGSRAVFEDRQGRIWVGTEGGGLCAIHPAPVRCLTTRDGLPHDSVYALASGRDGSLWVGPEVRKETDEQHATIHCDDLPRTPRFHRPGDRPSGGAGMTTFDRITVEPGKMSGQPCIRGMRITVKRVLLALAEYPNRDDFRRAYPDIDDEDIRQALGYAAANLEDHIEELVPLR